MTALIPGRARVLNVLHAVDAAREAHPELGRRLTWPALERVLARERIRVRRAPLHGKAAVVGVPPYFVILLNSSTPPRYHTRHVVHEYAHIRLHFGRAGEHERQLVPCRRDDVREWEAELFSQLLLLGPEATMDDPRIARLADRIVAAAKLAAAPAQIPLPLAAAKLTPAADPQTPIANDPRAPQPRPRGRPHPALRWSTIGRGISHDAMRLDWSQDGKPLRFFDLELGWLDVYDFRVIETPTMQRKPQLLRFGDSRVEIRLFVLNGNERRRYPFHPLERRRRGVKDLEAQLRAAISLPAEPPPRPTGRRQGITRPEDAES